DFAGVGRMQYPTEVRIIRTMCSARVAPGFIEQAFLQGAGMVLVSGCHPGDCHYIDANQHTERRVTKFRRRMEKLGLDKERLQLAWISAAEGNRFAEKIKDMADRLKTVTSQEIARTRKALVKKGKKTGKE
ncbi:MAG: hydrogenase iron-sulfur subunit, partial [Proteobacteria bacterium]|nr:hydrogenase iron-sulfur subunit [Pseudomonadota bacterium]